MLKFWLRLCLVTALFLAVIAPVPAGAQESTPQPGAEPAAEDDAPDYVPLAVVCAASFERLQKDVDFIFDRADRPELSDFLEGLLGNVGDLKGLDRTRPFGVAICLGNTLPPSVQPVAYLPVSNAESLLGTFALGPAKPQKVSEGRYKLSGERGPTFHLVFKDDYAFMSPNEEVLAALPDPLPIAQRLASRYDLSVTLRIQAIPNLLRTALLAFVKTQAQADLQRRDNEPEGAHRIRKAQGLSTLQLLEQVVTQLDQITIGLDASKELKKGVVEVNFDAAPDSAMAKQMQEFVGETTAFHSLFDDTAPLSLSACWKLDKRELVTMTESIEGLRTELRNRFETADAPTGLADRIADPLKATVETGAADFFLQFVPSGDKSFVLLGGGKLVGGATFSNAVRELFVKLQDSDDLANVEVDFANHQGVAIHKLVGKNIPKRDERVYGGTPGLYLAIGERTLWFAIGTDTEAVPVLESAMDRFADSLGVNPAPGSVDPFQAVFRMAPWLRLPPEEMPAEPESPVPDGEKPEETDRRAKRRAEREARRAEFMADLRDDTVHAFEGSKDDAIHFNLRPTDTGTRLRIVLDESYLRFLGLRIAGRIDRSQL